MSKKDRAAAILVTITLVVASFALGSAPRWAVCVTAGLCFLTVVPLIRSRRYIEKRPLVLLFLIVAGCATAMQLIPMPSSIVELLSPHRWDLAVSNARAWKTEPAGLLPFSYDPPGTLVELVKLCGYFAFAYVCFWLAASSAGRRWLMTAVALVGGAMAFTALAHGLVGADKLYGVYTPDFHPPRFMGPLLNPNHMAGLLAFSTPIAIGMAVAMRGHKRLAFMGIAFLTGGVTFLTQSRGGAISVVVASAATGALLFLQKRRGDQAAEVEDVVGVPKHVVVPATIMMACGLSLLVAITAGGVAQELSSTTTEQLSGETYKLEAWRSSKNMMGRHWMTGVGRGAFEFAFTRDHPASGIKTYSHIENEYLQTLLDWGVPVAAALGILATLIALAAARRRFVGPMEAGALGGMISLALHNFIDFNLEFPAVALPALAALAILLPAKLKETRSPRRRRMMAFGGLAGALVVLAVAASPLGRRAQAEVDDLDDDLEVSKGLVPHELVERAEDITERHPADYIAFGQAARVLVAKGDRRAVDVVNRSLDLNPQHPGLHWLAAQMLASTTQGHEQALIEYGLALGNTEAPRAILADMLVRFTDVGKAAQALPAIADVQANAALAPRIMIELSVLQRNDVALAWAERLHKALPDSAEMAGLVADYAILLGKFDQALIAAQQAYEKDQSSKNASRWARALTGLGRSVEADKMLGDAIVRVRSRGTREELVGLLTLMGTVQREEKKLVESRNTLVNALDLVSSDRKIAATIFRELAKTEDALGNPTVAAVHRARAEELDPTDLTGPLGMSAGTPPAPGTTTPAPGSKPTTPAPGSTPSKPAASPATAPPSSGAPATPAGAAKPPAPTPAKPATPAP